MTAIAPYLSVFLKEHLPNTRRASLQTCESYAYAFQLLINYAAQKFDVLPSMLELEQLDSLTVLAFLEHLEIDRGNSPRSRNARLAAINAFFRFLEYRLPSCLDQARRIHAIPMKKCDERLINYLTHEEVQALLNVPDPTTRSGIRDRAMIYLAFAAGLRVSELVGVFVNELDWQAPASIHVLGKGRRERVLPLWKETATALKAWLKVRGKSQSPELFLNAKGKAMTRSGFEYILAKHTKSAELKKPILKSKHISPHVLRHSCAMHMLLATRDVRKVSLWLGHATMQSTEVYLRADPTEKLEALAAAAPLKLSRGNFNASDKLLALLQSVHKGKYYAE